jgi:hypothetical protein
MSKNRHNENDSCSDYYSYSDHSSVLAHDINNTIKLHSDEYYLGYKEASDFIEYFTGCEEDCVENNQPENNNDGDDDDSNDSDNNNGNDDNDDGYDDNDDGYDDIIGDGNNLELGNGINVQNLLIRLSLIKTLMISLTVFEIIIHCILIITDSIASTYLCDEYGLLLTIFANFIMVTCIFLPRIKYYINNNVNCPYGCTPDFMRFFALTSICWRLYYEIDCKTSNSDILNYLIFRVIVLFLGIIYRSFKCYYVDTKANKVHCDMITVYPNDNINNIHGANNVNGVHPINPQQNAFQGYMDPYMNNDGNNVIPILDEYTINIKGREKICEAVFNNNRVKRVNIIQPSQNGCVICISDYQQNEKIKKLPCGHYYHSECLDNWLSHQLKCPMCNTILV